MYNKIIKTKESVQTIKTKDDKKNLEHFIKRKSVNEKEPIVNDKNKNKEEVGNQTYAVNRVETAQKAAAISSARRMKNYVQNKISKHKQKKELLKESEIVPTHTPIKTKESIKDIKVRSNSDNQKSIKTKSFDKSIITPSNKLKVKQTVSKPMSYSSKMKSLMMSKHKIKVKQTKEIAIYANKSSHVINRTIKGTFKTIETTLKSVSNLISYGTAFVLLIVTTLFIGVFACLSEDGGINSELTPLSPEVLAYEETIIKYAEQYNIKEYVPILEAIMMQESKGQGNDPMQSSESGFNTKYPRKPNGITDPNYSIEIGVLTFSDCLIRAKTESPTDTKKLYLALQGYNYGSGYIEWAVTNFGGYTKANAKVFSDEMKYKLGTKVYGDPNYVPHVLQYYHSENIDIVRVAKSQVGNVGGKPYWNWYGFNSRVEWCACFVSWCANETGQLNITIPKFALVEDGIQWFKANGKWGNKNYLPKSGDLIFFDWENDNDSDHVGIVEKVDNNYIYTIEGNSSDECKSKSYSIDSKIIYGYGKNNISKIQRN